MKSYNSSENVTATHSQKTSCAAALGSASVPLAVFGVPPNTFFDRLNKTKSRLVPSTIFLVAIILTTVPTLVRAADPTGRWKSEFETQAGQMKYTYDLKLDGDKVTGQAIRDRDGEIVTNAITEGKTTNDDISFVETAKIQDQDIRIEYSGKIAGAEMKLTRKVGDFGSTNIVAHLETNAATIASIDGNWQSEFDSGVGHLKYTYNFKLADGKVTGQAIREFNDEKTTNTITGKVTGTDLTFTEPLKVADAEIDIEYSGKIDGDKLELTRKVGDYGTSDITVTRAKDPMSK